MARTLMIQGAGSDVGKSLIVAGLARAAKRRGLRVLPFKPQNMSNNAAVTVDGGEIGRAQALQALAAGVEPHTDMNPVLLKPESDVGAQIIVQGKRAATARAREYAAMKPSLMDAVLESFARLKDRADLVLVEGAGSPAEVNLRKADIANMGFARKAEVPVVLIGDIDRGGVIAQLVGIKAVIDPEDAAMIRGFVINKFRGDPTLFDDGYRLIEARTSWRGFGVLPYFVRAGELPAEDALGLREARKPGQCKIAFLALSRIANFDDLDPLKLEPGVDLVMVRPGDAIPGDARLVIVPGSKSTRGDLAFLRAQGWDIDLLAHHRRGGHVLGLCGGYQMLGQSVADPDGIEGSAGETRGLGLLDVATVMTEQKTLTRVDGVRAATGQPISAYEIHIGRTDGPDRARPFAFVDGAPEGAVSGDGRVHGSYLHGLFASDDFRKAFLAQLDIPAADQAYGARVDGALDALADHIEAHLDVDGLLALAR
ncbi:cobyric acid synthase [Bradyrhizobium sp. ISRA443]|uniref:cobyric acid synthase n=1 Tax=unclassified Bradyrhizobium TaxID=2631580 RepID=UPI0024791ECD|nr:MULTISPECIES: cobyric acid synthase [unclassified Bradyrhizobium]WGR99998.1 cobyric acid synthase [Bradyrhizobium sp. ISRA436]WGS06889.1 cobyric acid synthase [Bradyrhizobium sp. ISRA437]WGS13771.1 cobyric acid synthase [Bradyrhizobium sp. ISRA443]